MKLVIENCFAVQFIFREKFSPLSYSLKPRSQSIRHARMTETGTNMFNFMFLGIATFARFGQKKTP